MAIVVFSNLITVLVLLDFALANVWSGQIALGADSVGSPALPADYFWHTPLN